jgi:uncharacterized membrane protein YgcG
MSTIKSGKAVCEEMALYSYRPGARSEAFPRGGEGVSGTVTLRIFDKGHFVNVDVSGLNASDTKRVSGRTIKFVNVNGKLCPEGFTPVSEKILLKYYGSRYTLNVRKIERALEEYHRMWVEYDKLRETESVRKPGDLRLESLYLDEPTDFEKFLSPYISYYYIRLVGNFNRLVEAARKNDNSLFTEINKLYYPDASSGTANKADDSVNRKFTAATGYVCVRLSEPFNMSEPDPTAAPSGTLPYSISISSGGGTGGGTGGGSSGGTGAGGTGGGTGGGGSAKPLTEEQKMEKDEEKMNQDGYLCLLMKPWSCYRIRKNPFTSKTYRYLFLKLQMEYEIEFNNFKVKMIADRDQYNREYEKYYQMKQQEKDATIKWKDIKHVDRPQFRNFTKEWREFISSLSGRMRDDRIYQEKPIDPSEFTNLQNNLSVDRSAAKLDPGDVRLKSLDVFTLQKSLETVSLMDTKETLQKIESVPVSSVIVKPQKTMKMKPLRATLPRKTFFEEESVKVEKNIEDPDLAVIMKDKSYSKGILMI